MTPASSEGCGGVEAPVPDLTRARATLDAELRLHQSDKRGAWEQESLLELLSHLSGHVTQARLMLVNNIDPATRYCGHDLGEHITHAATRAMMTLQRWLETDA
jgi:hypothetical protein